MSAVAAPAPSGDAPEQAEKQVPWYQKKIQALEARVAELEAGGGAAGGAKPKYVQVFPVPTSEDDPVPGIQFRAESLPPDGPWLFSEEITFAEDSGYDRNFCNRALSVIGRAFGANVVSEIRDGAFVRCVSAHVGVNPKTNQKYNYVEWDKLPPFNPQNRLRVTVEVVPHTEFETESE